MIGVFQRTSCVYYTVGQYFEARRGSIRIVVIRRFQRIQLYVTTPVRVARGYLCARQPLQQNGAQHRCVVPQQAIDY